MIEYMIMNQLKIGRALGAVATPKEIVEFMISLAKPIKERSKVLEPACGEGPFLKTFAEYYGVNHEFVGIDINPEAIDRAKNLVPFATFLEGDFLLWNPKEEFDIIIGNPPYGIIGDESHYPIHILKEKKAIYKKIFNTWYGKYNIYGAFIEHAIKLLKPDGKLIFIVPASWLVLDDFHKLRRFLAYFGRLNIYYLGKVFKGKNVSCVVLLFEKGKKGLNLFDKDRLVVSKSEYNGDIIRFETPSILEFERHGIPLGELFDIYFAARSPEFYSHPAVISAPKSGYVPVLTGRNLKAGRIDYENCYSGLWMPKEYASSLRFFYGFPHIVVGHTKGVRVVSALDKECYPWREEFHLVHRIKTLDLSSIVEYLNSKQVQDYVKTLYRDFVPHFTLTMLKRIPIPFNLIPYNFKLLRDEWYRI